MWADVLKRYCRPPSLVSLSWGGIAHGDPQLCHTPGVLTSPCLQQRRLFINLILFPIHISACQRHQWADCEVCRLILDVSRPLVSPLVAIVGHTLESPASATQARIDFLLSPMLRWIPYAIAVANANIGTECLSSTLSLISDHWL